jgi:hypothetical protein
MMDEKPNPRSPRTQGIYFVVSGVIFSVLFCVSTFGVEPGLRTPLLFGWLSCFSMAVGVSILKTMPSE